MAVLKLSMVDSATYVSLVCSGGDRFYLETIRFVRVRRLFSHLRKRRVILEHLPSVKVCVCSRCLVWFRLSYLLSGSASIADVLAA